MNYNIIILFIILCIAYIAYINYKKENMNKYYNLPKKIFTFWHSDDLDPIVNIHIQNWKNKLPDWEIHLITMKNINEYIPESYYSKFYNLIYQHFADHMRLYLLEKYGGVWIDGGIVILNPDFLNKMRIDCILNEYDIALFEYSTKSSKKHPYLENWFIMAPQNSNIIKLWKDNFDKCHFDGIDKCRQNIIDSGIDIENTIKNNNYLMMHAIINKLYLKNKINKKKIKIYEASDSMFKLQDKFNWDINKFTEYIISDNLSKINNYDNIYMIKLTKHFRNAFDTPEKIEKYKQKIIYL